MVIKEKTIEFYIDKLKKNEYFSFPGFGDSEWICILPDTGRLNTRSGYGQLHTWEAGQMLREALRIEDNYYCATPKAITKIREDAFLDLFLKKLGLKDLEFYERDMVTDDLAAAPGGLKPFIQQLREMNVVIIGNQHLKGLHFLNPKKIITIPDNDFHLHEDKMNKVIEECISYGKPSVYLFSTGISAAIMIGRLHGKISESWFIDVGSMWDAFVGIGGQREWRADLYKDTSKWLEWINLNLKDL